MLSVAQSILEESKQIKDEDRNETLKVFTVVTTMFVPLQFLTGSVVVVVVVVVVVWAAGRATAYSS